MSLTLQQKGLEPWYHVLVDGSSCRGPPTGNWRAPAHGCTDYLYGCDLYNHAYWWEAHEAWEGLWQLVDKTAAQGRLLQGLIQVSACALKVALGNRRGAQRLLERGGRHLRAVMDQAADPRFMGLALGSFLEAVNAYYRLRLDEGAAVTHDPDAFPYIVLRTEEAR